MGIGRTYVRPDGHARHPPGCDSFVTWDASLATRPIIQPNDMYPQKFVDFPCKISYHGTYMCNFPDIVRYGLESGSRAFVMMSKDPEWIRADSSELRERADIEFVIEPQLAVRDGLRLFETRSGALETPDWISNRYCIYVYQRGTFETLVIRHFAAGSTPR